LKAVFKAGCGTMLMEKNGLRLVRVKSRVENFLHTVNITTFKELEEKVGNFFPGRSEQQKGTEGDKGDGFALVYLDYQVMIGKLSAGKLVFFDREQFEPLFIQQARFFNGERELFLWKKRANSFYIRVRNDGEGEEVECVESDQIIWGTKSRNRGEWTELTEERGMKLLLPLRNIQVDNEKKRLKIRSRHYIEINKETSQAGYADCRLVSFVQGRN